MTKLHIRRLMRLVLPVAFFAGVTIASAHAQAPATYPNKVIKMMVGFPAGQATDLVARLLAERMSAAFGQPVIIENRPGQGGTIALNALARSAPDGHSMILAASGGLVTNPHLFKEFPFNPLQDFEPISLVAEVPLALVVNPSKPFNDIKSLVNSAKSNPGKLNHASTGNGTSSHLAMEALKQETKIDLVHVPYPGSVKALTDLVAGNVDVMFDNVAVTQQLINAGKLKILAVGSRKRLEQFPNTPTLAESGFPTIPAGFWIGMLFPKGTPAAVVNKVNAQLAKDLAHPVLQKKLLEMGIIPHPTSPQEFARFIKDEHTRMGKVVKESQITVE
ncbi:Bug family tripartite tricarboxylate transporter substrate binding protein [Noviherbaspirillum saxi]|uniref:Tripartite tricarboxylate transporter substrate binding protein n=1 Tax=Noviherbaspirillum saxi TaxID=2320863 RepID=A0A3A3G385_9BURK|nr:tripartite tricarboxylate transporter substrate binding protein [Noviherbaspirillum saxi]RJF92533.1 tripartite tricarboxylate transporter substrate binding protein [Noviherbaspirillum saxi]